MQSQGNSGPSLGSCWRFTEPGAVFMWGRQVGRTSEGLPSASHTPVTRAASQWWGKAEGEAGSHPQGHPRGCHVPVCVSARVPSGDPCHVQRCEWAPQSPHPSRHTRDRSTRVECDGARRGTDGQQMLGEATPPPPEAAPLVPQLGKPEKKLRPQSSASLLPSVPATWLMSPSLSHFIPGLGSLCFSATHPGSSGAFSGASCFALAVDTPPCRHNSLHIHSRPPSTLHTDGETRQVGQTCHAVRHRPESKRPLGAAFWVLPRLPLHFWPSPHPAPPPAPLQLHQALLHPLQTGYGPLFLLASRPVGPSPVSSSETPVSLIYCGVSAWGD